MRAPVRSRFTFGAIAVALAGCGSPSPVPPGHDSATPLVDDASAEPDDGAVATNPDGAVLPDDASVPALDAAGMHSMDGAMTPHDLSASVHDLATAPTDLSVATAHDLSATVHDLAAAAPSDMTGTPHDLAVLAPPDLSTVPHDMTVSHDLTTTHDMTVAHDLAMVTGGGGGGGSYVPPPSTDEPVHHAGATGITLHALAGVGGVYDVGADRGKGIWAVAPSTVYYWPPGRATPYLYSQTSSGLARGNSSYPFRSVAGGLAGEAYIGDLGAIGDHLVVNSSTGGVVKVENMNFTCSSTNIECQEQQQRVIAGLRMLVDFNGPFNGTAYNGGIHGVSAWHGVNGACGCQQFEEHQHYIPASGCDSTGTSGGCWGGDSLGLAVSPTGDLWIGDEHFVALLPQGGGNIDFLTPTFTFAADVFPNANDEVHALAVDGAGGVYVASYGQGMAYLAPMTYNASYFDAARELPQNRLTAVAYDPSDESIWIGTVYGGIARKKGTSWTYYTAASGLQTDDIVAIFVDTSTSPRRVIIGTDVGVAYYDGP